jgi:hypothetical protein
MGPRSRLARTEAIIPRCAERVLEIETGGNVNGRVLEERFASKVVVPMMVMVIRTGHLEGRMLECNVLAGDGLCGMRCVRMGAHVSMIRDCAAIGECAAGSAWVRESRSMSAGRGASSAHSGAAKIAGASTTATTTGAATTGAATTGAATCVSAAAAGRGAR